ncbi:YigZ family protein [Spiroplasma sp. TIUS-1]|uniref:IMPACT family protein n=1 Tax=Spiroplasma sp. TIUS-1 TaxID=216963 RepID=UPI0013973337|nr:YigZ family protein [Spiroplasma sp. TIUS-1]QHX35612.1 YigZ family protein [Spiroplasma sp. TIUS-1]
MKILKTDNLYTNEFVIKKSRFITIVKRVYSKSDIDSVIKENLQKDARHNCWAYILNDGVHVTESFHNDGEPSGTSGDAILKTLKSMLLTNVIVFVVRYFGGTKLGTGPLTRSYTQGIKTIVNENNLLKDLETGIQLTFLFNISSVKKIELHVQKEFINISKTYIEDKVQIVGTTKNETALSSISDLIELIEEKIIIF